MTSVESGRARSVAVAPTRGWPWESTTRPLTVAAISVATARQESVRRATIRLFIVGSENDVECKKIECVVHTRYL